MLPMRPFANSPVEPAIRTAALDGLAVAALGVVEDALLEVEVSVAAELVTSIVWVVVDLTLLLLLKEAD